MLSKSPSVSSRDDEMEQFHSPPAFSQKFKSDSISNADKDELDPVTKRNKESFRRLSFTNSKIL